jgi:hypothetical protein
MPRQVLLAYGMRVACPLALPGSAPSAEPADVEIALHAAAADVEARWSGPTHEIAERHVDGRVLSYHRGADGDSLLRWGDAGTWLLDAGRARIDAHSPADPPAPAWQRVLLDSVLGSVALGRGAEALHAGAVLAGGGAIAVLGASGAGKTSLLAALLERGYPLVADDVLVLAGTDPPAVHPGPPVLNVPGAATIGTPIARLGDETWVHVRAIAAGPVPLRALILLDRAPGGPTPAELVPEPQPFAPLFANLLPGSAGDDERFAIVAEMAARVPVLRLRADPEVTPDALAVLVEGA